MYILNYPFIFEYFTKCIDHWSVKPVTDKHAFSMKYFSVANKIWDNDKGTCSKASALAFKQLMHLEIFVMESLLVCNQLLCNCHCITMLLLLLWDAAFLWRELHFHFSSFQQVLPFHVVEFLLEYGSVNFLKNYNRDQWLNFDLSKKNEISAPLERKS